MHKTGLSLLTAIALSVSACAGEGAAVQQSDHQIGQSEPELVEGVTIMSAEAYRELKDFDLVGLLQDLENIGYDEVETAHGAASGTAFAMQASILRDLGMTYTPALLPKRFSEPSAPKPTLEMFVPDYLRIPGRANMSPFIGELEIADGNVNIDASAVRFDGMIVRVRSRAIAGNATSSCDAVCQTIATLISSVGNEK